MVSDRDLDLLIASTLDPEAVIDWPKMTEALLVLKHIRRAGPFAHPDIMYAPPPTVRDPYRIDGDDS